MTGRSDAGQTSESKPPVAKQQQSPPFTGKWVCGILGVELFVLCLC